MEVCRLAHMFCHMLTSEEHTRNTLGTHSMEVCRLAHMFCHMLTSYLTTPLSAWSVCAAKMDKNATECTRVRAALPRDTCVSTNRQCVCVCVRERESVCVCVCVGVCIHTSTLFLKKSSV